jgi:hypothetical protein
VIQLMFAALPEDALSQAHCDHRLFAPVIALTVFRSVHRPARPLSVPRTVPVASQSQLLFAAVGAALPLPKGHVENGKSR